jgi:hypothetical protein
MAEHQSEAAAIVTTLRMAGVSVSFDAQGHLDVGGKPRSMAAWAAMAEAIESLPKLVAGALRAEAGGSQNILGTFDPPSDLVLSRRERIGPGLKEMIGSDAPPAVPGVAQVTIPPPSPGRVKLPPASNNASPEFARISETTERFGISRSGIYREAAAGRIRLVKHGAATLVDIASLRAFMARLPAANIRYTK